MYSRASSPSCTASHVPLLMDAVLGCALQAINEMDQDKSGWVSQREFFHWWDDTGKSNIGRLLSSVINRQRENIKYLPGRHCSAELKFDGGSDTVPNSLRAT